MFKPSCGSTAKLQPTHRNSASHDSTISTQAARQTLPGQYPYNQTTPRQTSAHLDVLVHYPLGHGLGMLRLSVAEKLVELREALDAPAPRLGRLQSLPGATEGQRRTMRQAS